MSMKSALSIAIVAIVISACGASAPHRVETEETAAEFAGKSYKNLLIVGVYKDQGFRAGAETNLAEELKSRGVAASPSFNSALNPDAIKADAIAEVLASGSHDAVLTIATLDPGYEYDAGDYMATRGMVYMLGGKPGAGTDLGALIAWDGSGVYTLYVGLWDGETQKPVWQVTTDSEATGSESEDIRALADFIVENLRAKGLL